MKIAVIVVRTLVGALFAFGAVAYFGNFVPQPELTGNMKIFMEGLAASGYLITVAKVVELLVGIAFLSGRFVPLAAVIISPIIVNIFFIHLFLDRKTLPVAIALVLSNAFIAYAHRSHYAPLFRSKSELG
ncbi:DoxX family protein [Leptospira ryugenii]|uniref:DoxX family protein n=1 Tax=Leptospira ryugenii TaxID=1917863 RepID=A0A2P2E1Z9_9LEPT|nr:DoxX family protein [Leptospira ryugenii]GBF50918.1 DoxX family protein [Leptospira ryugenii]